MDLNNLKLDKAPFKRQKLLNQLYSGFLRLDFCEPLLRGNMIVLKGDKFASGKDLVVESAIKHFLREGSNHRVIYACLNDLRADQISKQADLSEDERSRMAIISADQYTTSDSEQYLAPIIALKLAQQLNKLDKSQTQGPLLLVVEDLLLQ